MFDSIFSVEDKRTLRHNTEKHNLKCHLRKIKDSESNYALLNVMSSVSSQVNE
jgi:hypothetical protein